METPLPFSNAITTHQRAREQGYDLLRRNVIEAASRLLVDEGPDALTVRRIAQELECSTKIIYTMFKGKEGLADALYLEGCILLGQAIGHVARAARPADYIHDVAWAYWSFALTHPSYYMVMFCGAMPNFQPSSTSIRSTMTAFDTIVDAMHYYITQGMLPDDDLPTAVKALWAPLHGVISLHFMGHFSTLEQAREIFARTVQTLTTSSMTS